MAEKVLSREAQVELVNSGLTLCEVIEMALVATKVDADPNRVRLALTALEQALQVYKAGMFWYQEQLNDSTGDVTH